MIKSTLIQRIVEEARRSGRVQAMIDVLVGRFGAVTPTVCAGLEQIKDMETLLRLTRQAARCEDLQAFEADLRAELHQEALPSPRSRKKPDGSDLPDCRSNVE